jgi:hypothetical protein
MAGTRPSTCGSDTGSVIIQAGAPCHSARTPPPVTPGSSHDGATGPGCAAPHPASAATTSTPATAANRRCDAIPALVKRVRRMAGA